MGRSCSICQSRNRPKIDKLLASGNAIRGISRTFHVSEDALSRHKAHLREVILRAADRKAIELGDSLVEQVCSLGRKALELQQQMEGEGDLGGSVVALREARECINTQGDMLAKIERAHVIDSPPEIEVRIIDVSAEHGRSIPTTARRLQ